MKRGLIIGLFLVVLLAGFVYSDVPDTPENNECASSVIEERANFIINGTIINSTNVSGTVTVEIKITEIIKAGGSKSVGDNISFSYSDTDYPVFKINDIVEYKDIGRRIEVDYEECLVEQIKKIGEFVPNEKIESNKMIKIISLNPLSTAVGYLTEFVVEVEGENITKYEWEFGDNTNNVTTTQNTVNHTYNSTGIYALKITLNSNLSYSKTFNINVSYPKDRINQMITEREINLEYSKTRVKEFSEFYQERLGLFLDLNYSETELNRIKTEFARTGLNDSDYVKIMADLIALKIPKSIGIIGGADYVPFYPDENDIAVDVLADIGGGNYDSSKENEYLNSINLWYQENLDVKLKHDEISFNYGDYNETINIFELKINSDNSEDYYVVLEKLNNFEFNNDNSKKTEGNYNYVKIFGDQTIVFSTTSNVDFESLPLFISPALSKLKVPDVSFCNENGECNKNLGENWKNCKSDCFAWPIVFIIGGIIIVGIILYLIMRRWYKTKYEEHLFKKPKNLLNLTTYVGSSKKKGIKKDEIKKRLKSVGWKSEQIDYAMKKQKRQNSLKK